MGVRKKVAILRERSAKNQLRPHGKPLLYSRRLSCSTSRAGRVYALQEATGMSCRHHRTADRDLQVPEIAFEMGFAQRQQVFVDLQQHIPHIPALMGRQQGDTGFAQALQAMQAFLQEGMQPTVG